VSGAKYDYIFQVLRHRIESGEYEFQSLLPSENVLATDFSCTRNTVRKALALLASQGHIQPMQGRGIQVIHRRRTSPPQHPSAFLLGGIESLMSKLPGEMGQLSAQIPEGTAEKAMSKVEAIINSMTPKERANPALLKASRKRRIAAGAGTTVQEVNKMLKQFEQSQKMMKMFGGKGMGKLMRMAQGMKGMFPGR